MASGRAPSKRFHLATPKSSQVTASLEALRLLSKISVKVTPSYGWEGAGLDGAVFYVTAVCQS